MAISYGGQLFESTSTVTTNTLTLGSAIPAGTLIAVAFGGKRSGSNLGVVTGPTDSKGQTWARKVYGSTFRCIGLAWCRTSSSMSTSDWVRIKWNGTPSTCWITGHYFTNASGTATDSATAASSGPSATASATVNVPGTEYLVLTAVNLAYDYGVTTTPLNSMTERDTYTTSPQQREFLSRNTSGGSTFQGGTSLSPAVYWSAVSVSFAAEAPSAPPPPPPGTSIAVGRLMGV
jgi:hypothetical protein